MWTSFTFCDVLCHAPCFHVLFHFAAGRPGHPRGREHRGVVAQAAVPVEDAEQKERPVAVLLVDRRPKSDDQNRRWKRYKKIENVDVNKIQQRLVTVSQEQDGFTKKQSVDNKICVCVIHWLMLTYVDDDRLIPFEM